MLGLDNVGIVAVALFALMPLLFIVYYLSLRSAPRSSQRTPLQDLTEMTLLFQTLRGVLHDQKTLAREFNESVDKRVALIRQVVNHTLEESRKIAECQREIGQTLERVKRELVEKAENRGARAEGIASSAADIAPASTRVAADDDEPLLHIVAAPSIEPEIGDIIESWAGLDFVTDDLADPFEIPENVPEAPRDPETAREAFRALLSLDAEPKEVGERPPVTAAPDATKVKTEPTKTSPYLPKDDGGNGRDKTAMVRTRVYEYNDAGMTVADIARELGIGKGEVRLMLSLRDK